MRDSFHQRDSPHLYNIYVCIRDSFHQNLVAKRKGQIHYPHFKHTLIKGGRSKRLQKQVGSLLPLFLQLAFAAYFLNFLLHPHDQKSEELTIYGTGEANAVFTCERDIGMYTIKVANDPRTCNCTVFFRPPKNVISQLELVSLWERKTGRNFKKVYVSEEEIVKLSQTSTHPHDVRAAIVRSIFVKGDMANFELREDDMEISKLYPDFEYTTVDQLVDLFVANAPKFEHAAL